MKRFLAIMLLTASVLLPLQAQKNSSTLKKDLAQAKSYLKAGNNLEKAEQLMQKHLADSANRQNERLWLTMFEALKKQYEQGNMKLYLKQKYDTAALFNITKRMFSVLESFDSIDARPDDQGVVKPQYRKRHSEFLNTHRSNLYNGGVYFIGKQKFAEAYSFFDMYLDCAWQPLLSSFDYNNTDSRMPEAAYWAVYCGYKMQDAKATLHHTYLALKDTAHYCMMLQYLAETYKLEKDSTRYEATLREGFDKYPAFQFFFLRLVEHYVGRAQWDSVLGTANRALDNDSTSVVYQLVRSTALLNLKQYEECIATSDQLIAANDSLAEAWYNAGMSCYNLAINLENNSKPTAKQKKQRTAAYDRARHYLEQFRKLAPDDIDRWALPLYNIYLNLNMGKEFEEIDGIIKGR